MIARLKNSKNGKNLPQDWAESLARLMNETYSTECKLNGRYFDIFGQIYQDELLLVVSYLSEKDEYIAPITLFLSSSPDQIANVEKVTETQHNFIEVAGLFFDEIFANDDWNEFEPAWQEVTHKHQNYFYKISRENINATIEADKLLGSEFEDIEYDQDPEH